MECPEEGRPLDDGDDALVQRAKEGDVDAFAALVARYERVALRVAYTLVGADAEDVVQEAMVKAYRNIGRFRPGGPFRAWLMKIVPNEASNRRRARGRRAALAVRVAAQPSAASAMSPEDEALAHERRQSLAEAISALPEGDRTVIALRWFAELSEKEMAVALGCRPGTVKSRLARAMDRLRKCLAGEERELVS